MTKFTKIIGLITCAFIGLGFFSTLPVFADDICSSNVADSVKEAAGCNGTSSDGLPNAVINIINVIIGLIGIVAVIFIIVGGVRYMTSIGDAGKVKKARDTILYAVIGLIICILAFAIVNFVIDKI